MKLEEKDYLKCEKLKEGKDEEVIYEEIENLEQSQIEFKKLNKETKKLKKELEKKDKRIEKLQRHNFKLIPDVIEKKKINGKERSCQVKHLKRILKNMTNEFLTIKELSKILLIKTDFLKEGLNFLADNNLIKRKEEYRVFRYSKWRYYKNG